MSAVNMKVVVEVKRLEHLSTSQFGVGVIPARAASMMNVWGRPSALTRLTVTESPFVTYRVGPGLLPFHPVEDAPVKVIV
jgi:hypothetical protein